MSGSNLFLEILQVVAFLVVVWFSGRVCRAIGVSPILGEILAGVVMGPHVLDVVPYEDHAGGHSAFPSVFVLAGNIGVTLMIMLSGMHMKLEHLLHVGKRATAVAVCGTLLPIACGIGVLAVVGVKVFPDGLAAGVTLAPTSVGIAIKLLTERKVLKAYYGQVILAAAFIDDLLSLLCLVILQNLAAAEVNFFIIAGTVLAGAAFLGLGCWLSAKWFPKLMKELLSRVSERVERSHQPRDELQLGMMLLTLVACGLVGMVIGSHLLGAFVAGILFSDVPRSPIVWRRQLKRVSSWLLRLFFAATVAFSIPTEVLFNKEAILHGLALSVLAALLAKMAAGLGAGRENAFVVGCAMVPRGEFAYFVAAMSVETTVESLGQPLMSQSTYAATVWALLVSAVVAPFVFSYALRRQLRAQPRARSRSIGKEKDFSIRVEGMHRAGLLPEVIEVLSQLTLEVKEAVIETDGKVDVQVFTVQLRDVRGEVDDEKLSEIKHEILDAVNDPDAQVVCIPAEPLNYNMLEIQVTCAHHSNMLTEVTEVLHKHNLEVKMATCLGTVDNTTDVEVLYAQNLRRPDTRIGGDVAYGVRAALRELMRKHNIKGEVMVKPPKWSQIPSHAIQQPRPVLEGQDVMKVCVEADTHQPVVLHEVAQQLCRLGLDVVTADIETGEHDLAVFYVKAQPGTKHNSAAAVKRALVLAIKAQQVNDCHVHVEHPVISSSLTALSLAQKAEQDSKYERLDTALSSPSSAAKNSPTPLAPLRANSVRVMAVAPQEINSLLNSSSGASLYAGSPSRTDLSLGPAHSRGLQRRNTVSPTPTRAAFEDDSDSDEDGQPSPMRHANMRVRTSSGDAGNGVFHAPMRGSVSESLLSGGSRNAPRRSQSAVTGHVAKPKRGNRSLSGGSSLHSGSLHSMHSQSSPGPRRQPVAEAFEMQSDSDADDAGAGAPGPATGSLHRSNNGHTSGSGGYVVAPTAASPRAASKPAVTTGAAAPPSSTSVAAKRDSPAVQVDLLSPMSASSQPVPALPPPPPSRGSPATRPSNGNGVAADDARV